MSERKRIAIFGGSFNPPGEHHRDVARTLSAAFDEIIVVPCGPRPDKPTTDDIDPVYRAAMVDMTFRDLPNVRADLFDLERGTFTRTHELEEKYSSKGEIWHVVGADLIRKGEQGMSQIEREWREGRRLWRESRFAICTRAGHPVTSDELPPNHCVFNVERSGSSAAIRSAIFEHRDYSSLVVPDVGEYVERYRLYRGSHPQHSTRRIVDRESFELFYDGQNGAAVEIAEALEKVNQKRNGVSPAFVLVIGGDGTMLRAIRSLWRLRVPFYGMNAGHVGMLLNERNAVPRKGQEIVIQHLPLLWIEATTEEGELLSGVAFNDGWVERATGQAAWVELKIDGTVRLPRIIADGALVATAAGSSSYAAAMGVSPLPFDTRVLLLVGSNVFRPHGWKSATIRMESEVVMSNCDPSKRPLNGFIDGVPLGRVREMKVRISRTSSVELAFQPETDSATKLAKLQFPEMD